MEHFSISPRSSYMWRECKDIFKQKNLKYYCFLFLDLECFILAKPFLLVGHHLHDLLVPHLLDHIGVREDVTEKNFFWALPKLPLPHPTARNLDKFYSYVFAPKIESVKINLGKAVPLQHTIWATFSLFKMCQNLGEAQKQGCFFWELFPVRPDWAGGIFVKNEEKIILIRPKHFSGTRCVFSKQFETNNGGDVGYNQGVG